MDTCVVCGEPVDETNSAVCHGCGRPYHLVLKHGTQGKDCGQVWVDDLSTSLVYACSNCIRETRGDPAPTASPRDATVRIPPARARRARGRRRYRKR